MSNTTAEVVSAKRACTLRDGSATSGTAPTVSVAIATVCRLRCLNPQLSSRFELVNRALLLGAPSTTEVSAIPLRSAVVTTPYFASPV